MGSARIIVAGGGIGGLAAALALHAAGHEVEVHEAVVEPRELGVGINLLPHSVRVLHGLGLGDELDRVGVRTSELRFTSADGTLIWSEPRGVASGAPWPQYSLHRGRLHAVLLAAVRDRLGPAAVRTGHRVVDVHGAVEGATSAAAVVVDRRTGERAVAEGDAVVGADGIRSVVRALLHPTGGELRHSGLVLWRGATWRPPFLDGSTMVMSGDHRQKAVVYPISPPRDDGRVLVNWVAERPVADGAAPVDWNAEVDPAEVAGPFAGWDLGWLHVGELLAATEVAYEFPMVDRDPLERWTSGRVTLLGDAAHAMRPNGSNGSSQAVLDGESLAAALSRHDVDDALAAYEAERREPTARLTLANRRAGPERVMSWVAERCDGRCVGEHTCVGRDELEREANAYKELAGFDLDRLRRLADAADAAGPARRPA